MGLLLKTVPAKPVILLPDNTVNLVPPVISDHDTITQKEADTPDSPLKAYNEDFALLDMPDGYEVYKYVEQVGIMYPYTAFTLISETDKNGEDFQNWTMDSEQTKKQPFSMRIQLEKGCF